jgi:hypothetical protein
MRLDSFPEIERKDYADMKVSERPAIWDECEMKNS